MKTLNDYMNSHNAKLTNYYNKIYDYCKLQHIELVIAVLDYLHSKYDKSVIMNDLYKLSTTYVWDKPDTELNKICKDKYYLGVPQLAYFAPNKVKYLFNSKIYRDIAGRVMSEVYEYSETRMTEVILYYVAKFIFNLELKK